MNAFRLEKQGSAAIDQDADGRPEDGDAVVADATADETAEVESEIRNFVRNDVAYLRRSRASVEPPAEATVNNVNFLIQRVAGASLAEISNLIDELETLRELLHSEGQRVQREIAGYAQLSQAAMKSTRVISDNMASWKSGGDGARRL
jgi:hypothetical protein